MKKRCVSLLLLAGFVLLACNLPGVGRAVATETNVVAEQVMPDIPDTPAPVPTATIQPTATPDMRPVTVQINADGSGDYASLPEAVAAVPPGSTINLGAGTFNLPETLHIKKPLHIIGVDPQQTIIHGTDNMIYVDVAGTFSFQNIALAYTSSNYGSCLGIANGEEIHVKNCRFSGAVHDDEIEGTAGGVGVWVGGSTTGVIEQSEFYNNQSYGISVSDKARLALISNHCHENAEDGIALFEESEATLLYNRLENNGDNGVWIQDDASAEVADNTLTGNAFDGIVLRDNSSVVIRDNMITENGETGVWFEGSASAEVTNNTIIGNDQDGISLLENSSALIEGNMIYENSRHGILLKGQSQAEIIGNSIKGNGEVGIYFLESTGGLALDNQVYENQWGIYIEAGANPQLSGNGTTGNTKVDFIDKR